MRRSNSFPRGTTRRALLRNAGGATVVAGAILGIRNVSAARAQDDESTGLIGSWRLTGAAPGSRPNTVLATFLPGGVFMRAGNTHPTETPGFGAWKQVSDDRFEATYMVVQFDTAGTIIGHRKAWLDVTLNPSGMSWTGRTRAATIDLSGNETLGPLGATGAERIVAEPFESG
jgi:hypothetical protein